ncbi:MAG: hypothetical protein JRF55_12425 [Deltaproteobacteria bacterium]|nr:hypothetical protein [Deltaproteobacteria bacterium]
MSSDFTSLRQRQVNERISTLPAQRHSLRRSALEPGGQRKQKSRMVSFRVDEDDFIRLDALARQTSCSRAEVLRRCLRGVRLKSTADAQALTAVSRVHADLNRMQRQQAWNDYRDSASGERRRFKEKYRHQRSLLSALPVSGRDRKRLSQQLALRQAIESRTLRRKLANQRKAIQKSPQPGTWRHFVAGRAAHGDARAIRLLPRREQERSHGDLDGGS